MKKLICLFLVLIATSAFAGGASVDFAWTQAPNDTWGTKILIGTEPGVYPNSEDAGINTTTATVENLQYSTPYFFTAVYYDQDGFESEYAQEIAWTSPDVPGVTFEPLPEIVDSGVRSYTITLTIPN